MDDEWAAELGIDADDVTAFFGDDESDDETEVGVREALRAHPSTSLWRYANRDHLRRYMRARSRAIRKVCEAHYDEYVEVYDGLCAEAGVEVQTNMRRNVYGTPQRGGPRRLGLSAAEKRERNNVLSRLRDQAKNVMRERYREEHDEWFRRFIAEQ